MGRPRRTSTRTVGYAGGTVSEAAFETRMRVLVAQHLRAGTRVTVRGALAQLRVNVRSLGTARRIAIQQIARAHTQRIAEWLDARPDVQAYARGAETSRAQAWALRAAATVRSDELRGVDFDAVDWRTIAENALRKKSPAREAVDRP
jgi:hypothetical protein